MPNCKKCFAFFPVIQSIDGKDRNLSRRAFCLTCSPFNSQKQAKNFSCSNVPEGFLRCFKCEELKAEVDFYNRNGYIYSSCKSCHRAANKINRDKQKQQGTFKCRKVENPLSQEEKNKRTSEGRKKWLAENPDKHPWKKNIKFKSEPCEKLKQILKDNDFIFEDEFQPLEDRFFSLDIAFVANKVALEVNGQQHYDSDKTLKPYYQERHNLIEAQGWKILEIHYLSVYDESFIESLLESLRLDLPFPESKIPHEQNKVKKPISVLASEERKKKNRQSYANRRIKKGLSYDSRLPRVFKASVTPEEWAAHLKAQNSAKYRKKRDKQGFQPKAVPTAEELAERKERTKRKERELKQKNRLAQGKELRTQAEYLRELSESLEPEREKRRELILSLQEQIDFSKFGWGVKLGQVLGLTPQNTTRWVKKNMPEFFDEKCFKK